MDLPAVKVHSPDNFSRVSRTTIPDEVFRGYVKKITPQNFIFLMEIPVNKVAIFQGKK